MYQISFYIALALCAAGTLYRIANWFRTAVGPESAEVTFWARLAAALHATVRTLFSRRLLSLLRAFVGDALLQLPILKRSPLRWCLHLVIFWGFILLVLLHALDDQITALLFPEYQSTLNPFFFLRNLMGFFILAGVAGVILRRSASKLDRRFTNRGDAAILLLVSLILVSGFLLEASQIISEPVFDEMVADYMGEDDPEELVPLKIYWARNYGVVFNELVATHGQTNTAGEQADIGEETHYEYCAACHDRPASAFMSYPLALGLRPLALTLNRLRIDVLLWYIHFLSVFAALALLPHGKFFHLIATPLSLVARKAAAPAQETPAARANRRALGLDACTHCGICSRHCSVAPIYALIPNATILPSEKLAAVRQTIRSRGSSRGTQQVLSEGSFICTECTRCTTVCPAGIDLQDLWQASKKDLARAGFPPPHHWIKTKKPAQWAAMAAASPAREAVPGPAVSLTDNPETFANCVQCTTCTTVCPVVDTVDDPQQELDLTPQQIMNLLRLEMKDTALGARMVWKCVTCYQCQEQCPQGVRVTDVLYELRNIACNKLKTDG